MIETPTPVTADVLRQLAELRETQHVHDTFTELTIAEAGSRQILDAVAQLSGVAVVLEDTGHRIVDYRPGPDDSAVFLHRWQVRSRMVELAGRTSWDETNGWLLTRLGRRDRGWGRLVIASPEPPSPRTIAVAERAAAALAMYRMHDQNRSGMIRRAHQEALVGILADPDAPRLPQHCELLGLSVFGRSFVGATVRPVLPLDSPGGPPASLTDDVIAALVRAADELGVSTLVANVNGDIRALLSLPVDADHRAVIDELAEAIDRRYPILLAAGRPVARLHMADRTLKEAQHVAESVPQDSRDRVVHRVEDVHVRGLLTMLGDDERLRLFVDRELRPLKEYDERYKAGLIGTLWALLRFPGNKSDAAASLNMSRPAFYDRLNRISKLLDADLDDPDIRVSLHLALIADELSAGTDR